MGRVEELWSLRAYSHGWWFGEHGQPQAVEARAGWRRADPLASYEPVARTRDRQVGAHVAFMNLARMLREERDRFDHTVTRFANDYGLLGLFRERFSGPVLPEGKVLVAPNVHISKTGDLHSIDPETKGIQVLEELLHRTYGGRGGESARPDKRVRLREKGLPHVALPGELRFYTKDLIPTFGQPVDPWAGSQSPEIVSWQDAEDAYGLHVVLDKHAYYGVSVLSTREPISSWEMELKRFPLGEDLTEDQGFSFGKINTRIAGVSPYGFVGEGGVKSYSWRCPSLLAAIYHMLLLDVCASRRFPRCLRRESCGRYFRTSPRSKAAYCSDQCASVASTRRSRGQTP